MWIKICGMTDEDAVAAALSAGVEAIGFVFAPSVRQVTPERAAALSRAMRGRAAVVAVTLHPTQQLIDTILREVRPDVLQSDLDDLRALSLPSTLGLLPVLRSGSTASGSPALAHHHGRLLFEGARSGSGHTADWSAAAQLAGSGELILAGGLHPANVGEAIRSVRPFGVDVSSGVEHAPGHKSPEKIAQFVAAARAAFKECDEHGNRSVG
jgi:phosphoribosylanthranilate isomerase